jgi:hypothetical protein
VKPFDFISGTAAAAEIARNMMIPPVRNFAC